MHEGLPSPGEQMRLAREHLGLSLDDVAVRTRLRPSVVSAVENGDLSPLGEPFYQRAHIRSLAQMLGLDAEQVWRDFEAGAPHEAGYE